MPRAGSPCSDPVWRGFPVQGKQIKDDFTFVFVLFIYLLVFLKEYWAPRKCDGEDQILSNLTHTHPSPAALSLNFWADDFSTSHTGKSCIHPSILYTLFLLNSGVQGSDGASPSCHAGDGRGTPWPSCHYIAGPHWKVPGAESNPQPSLCEETVLTTVLPQCTYIFIAEAN